uniref:Pre-mRNA-splicing factor 38 n=1 Tax=Spongospora subterranea TaxID=70186 RepID=A0A0H5R7Z4_9EUKA|eukprot:CRZ09941.1 hypothetical protein [Spongospora subterranea]
MWQPPPPPPPPSSSVSQPPPPSVAAASMPIAGQPPTVWLPYMPVQPGFDMSMYQEYRSYNGVYNYTTQYADTGNDSGTDEDDELHVSHPAVLRMKLSDKDAKKTVVEMVCDAQYNVNNVLATNILNSDYFKDLFVLKTFHEVVKEVIKRVTHLEALTIGQTRLPSTAFCLLYKLFTLKLTVKQLGSMLSDSKPPFVRGLGLLYLRFVHPPRHLWAWFAPLLYDTTMFNAWGPNTPPISIGKFTKSLLLELQYPGILLPRIPVPVLREYKRLCLTGADGSTEPAFKEDDDDDAIESSTYSVGMMVRAQYYDDGKYYDAIIENILPNNRYRVAFVDYHGEQADVKCSAIKLPTERSFKGKTGSPKRSDRSINEEIRRQERASALAHGKDYASRPASCKATMSINEHKRRRSRSPPRREREVVKTVATKVPSPPQRSDRSSPPRNAETSVRQAELRARYGDASSRAKQK